MNLSIWEISIWRFWAGSIYAHRVEIVLNAIFTRKDSVVLVPLSTKVTLCSKVKTPKIAPA